MNYPGSGQWAMGSGFAGTSAARAVVPIAHCPLPIAPPLGFDMPVAGACAGQKEILGLGCGDVDPAARPLLFRVPTHELCDRLTRAALRIPDLTHDLQPAPRYAATIGEPHPMRLERKIRFPPADVLP